MNGERVHAGGQLIRKYFIDHAMAVDPGLSFEGFRHDIDPEMSLSARPVSGMAFVPVGFVHHIEALRNESLGQLFCDEFGSSHAAQLGNGSRRVNGLLPPESCRHIVVKS